MDIDSDTRKANLGKHKSDADVIPSTSNDIIRKFPRLNGCINVINYLKEKDSVQYIFIIIIFVDLTLAKKLTKVSKCAL